MSMEIQLWVRIIQNGLGLVLVIMAAAYCFALWLETRFAYLFFGWLALLTLVPLALLRILAVPEPPLLPQSFVDAATVFVNAAWPVLGLAWLAALLRHHWRLGRARRGIERIDADTEGEPES